MGEKKIQKQTSRKMRKPGGILIAFIIICLIVCLFSFQYYKRLHSTIREESKNYLMEVSRRIGSNMDIIIKDNFATLYTIGASLEYSNAQTLTEISPLLQEQKGHWNYENILIVDQKGKAYDINGSGSVFFAFDDALRSDMLNQKRSMTTTQIVNNKEFIIFAVPLSGVTLDGENMIALAACYDPASFDKVLSMSSFADQAYSQIITKSGTVVTRPTTPHAIKSGYNIFSTLQNASLDNGADMSVVRDEINHDIENQISLSLDGLHRYMIYTPIQPDEWYLLTFVPFQVVNAKSDMLLQTTLIICGLIAATFCGLIAALFLTFRSNQKILKRIAYVDDITGGNTIQKFYDLARNALKNANGKQYALIYTNIENFKVLNSQLGIKNCNEMLYHFNAYTTSTLTDEEYMGRLSADNFCILMYYTDESELLKRLENWAVQAEQYIKDLNAAWPFPSNEFGIFVIDNPELPFPEMVDRAKLALKESRRPIVNKLQCAFYDDQARRRIFREKQISDMMESSMANREFKLYLQPKYRLSDETIGGAEALVRWESTTEGIIYPDEFIPLFERNGFIVRLDLFMFEEVCRSLRRWCDLGLNPCKISVNCSRIHFKNPAFLDPYISIASQYNIDSKLIEIELTESVVFENTDHLIQIINQIHEAGFGCSMDDFGSGYSSLNLIQSIPVDTLKIDKIFFRGSQKDLSRIEAVVGSIVQMAQSLSMVTVAEGVEHREQVDMLKRVGCNYIQGYVFARPMKVTAFEELTFGSVCTEKVGDEA